MPITVSTWKNPLGGIYTTATNWAPSGAPNAGNADAFLDTLSLPYVVTSSSNETLDFLQVQAGAALALAGGVFAIDSSVHTFSNVYDFGAIGVRAGATLLFGQLGLPSTDSGEINGPGVVGINSANPAQAATLAIAEPFFGLYGGVRVALSGNARIIGMTTDANTFFIKNAIVSGSGVIGNGAGASGGNGLSLTNGALGTINANGATPLVLNTGSNAIKNAGTIATTGTGGLIIDSSMDQEGRLIAAGPGAIRINGAEIHGLGTITVGAAGSILLNNGQFDIGGIITVGSAAAPGGSISTTSGNTSAIGPSNAFTGDVLSTDLYNYGSINITSNSTLNFSATLYNKTATIGTTGRLNLFSAAGAAATLEIFGTGASIWGGGVNLSNSVNNIIQSNGAGQQLSNYSTISGAGTIGDTWLRLYNSPLGVVNANLSAGMTLIGDSAAVAAGSENTMYNAGTVAATGAGKLTIEGVLDNSGRLIAGTGTVVTLDGASINNGGGIVATSGTGTIVLENNAQIFNQAYLAISVGGKVTTSAGDSGDLVETSVINNGAFNVVAGSTAIVDKHWQNYGSVNLNGSTLGADIEIEAGQVWYLVDGGAVNLNGSNDSILSAGAGTRLLNRDNTIKGSGVIGDSNMTVDNAAGAIIDATGAGGLTLDSTAFDTTTQSTFLNNAGVIESNSAGGLTIESAMFNSGRLVANTGGNIVAQDAVFGAGVARINGSGSIEFGAEADNDVVYGPGGSGKLILDDSAQLFGNIYGLGVNDSIDLRDFKFVSGDMALSATSGFGTLDGDLQITNGISSSANLFVEGNYTPAFLTAHKLAFQYTDDGHALTGGGDGTLIKLVAT